MSRILARSRRGTVTTCAALALCSGVILLLLSPAIGSSLPSTRAEIQRLPGLSAVTPDRPSKQRWDARARPPGSRARMAAMAAGVARRGDRDHGHSATVPPRLTVFALDVGLARRGPPA